MAPSAATMPSTGPPTWAGQTGRNCGTGWGRAGRRAVVGPEPTHERPATRLQGRFLILPADFPGNTPVETVPGEATGQRLRMEAFLPRREIRGPARRFPRQTPEVPRGFRGNRPGGAISSRKRPAVRQPATLGDGELGEFGRSGGGDSIGRRAERSPSAGRVHVGWGIGGGSNDQSRDDTSRSWRHPGTEKPRGRWITAGFTAGSGSRHSPCRKRCRSGDGRGGRRCRRSTPEASVHRVAGDRP